MASTKSACSVRPAWLWATSIPDDAALRAVENEPSQYKAAYFTLNPIKLPDAIPVNPQALTPVTQRGG